MDWISQLGDWINQVDTATAYVVIFIVLYVSGAGVPIPEEFPLAASGYFIAIDKMSWWGVALNVGGALVLGDLTAYWLGRRFGNAIWKVPPFRWVLTPARFAKVKQRFHEHQGKALFFGRFFAGVRLVTFIFAGITRVRVIKFVIIDALAAMLSAPIFIVVAYLFGQHLESARHAVGRANLVMMAIVLTVIGVCWVVWEFKKRRREQTAPLPPELAGELPTGKVPNPDASVKEPTQP